MSTQSAPKPKISHRARLEKALNASYSVVRHMASTPDHFVLPLPPNIANNSMIHWRNKHALHEVYFRHCDNLRACGVIPPPPEHPPYLVEARVVAVLPAGMDDGNLMNRLKWAEDWLVRNGYLTDDKKANLRYAGFPEQQIDRKAQRLEIWLTTIEQNAPVKPEKSRKRAA